MTKEQFTTMYDPLAKKAGDRFGMNPEIILAQAALESGWGSSYGARVRKNFFGITAAGSPNEFWDGSFSVGQNQYALKFRVYKTEQDSFYALGDIRQPKVLEHAGSKENDNVGKAGRLKIRGLRSRGEVEFNGGRNAKRPSRDFN